jgi:hypothetical protein
LRLRLKNKFIRKFANSKAALALPMTFMILFVSTLGIVAFTYYFSSQRINLQSQTLKISEAKQGLLSLDDAVTSILGQSGSAGTVELGDYGGRTNVEPTSNLLTIEVSDGSSVVDTIFSASIGRVVYELPAAESSEAGEYLKGDSRVITNQSGVTPSQLCIVKGAEHEEIHLSYRPTVSCTSGGLEDGKIANTIRVYIVNLNSSGALALMGKLPLVASCTSMQLTTHTYTVAYQPESVQVSATLNGSSGSVSVPVQSNEEGAVIHVEIVESQVSIARWIR